MSVCCLWLRHTQYQTHNFHIYVRAVFQQDYPLDLMLRLDNELATNLMLPMNFILHVTALPFLLFLYAY